VIKRTEIAEILRDFAEEELSAAGKPYAKISLQAVLEISGSFSLSLKEIEILALENKIIPERYQRSLGTINGPAGQISLLQSQAAVIGLGGLGGLAAELLARMGVGILILADGDFFSESNLNRQLLSTLNNLGKSKAEQAALRIRDINGAVETRVVAEYITPDNAKDILQGSQVVLDCLDNLFARFVLQESCQKLGLPIVHGAIAQFYGQVSTIMPGDPGFNSIYGYNNKEKQGIEKELGNPAATPAIVAAWQVQEAIKFLLGIEPLLRNNLLLIDTLSCVCETIPLSKEFGRGD